MNNFVYKIRNIGFILSFTFFIFVFQNSIYAQDEETDTILPVSERTTAVREAIVAAVSGVTDAANVTETHLAAITTLNLRNKSITTLKSGDFSGLTGMTDLNLYGNQLSSLPDGIFVGLTALARLRLGGNTINPMPLSVALKVVGENQYKVVVPTAAPFSITVSVVLTDGTTPETLGTYTVAQGSVESSSFTATSVAGKTVQISSTLPTLPTNHYGYTLSKSATIPLESESIDNNAPVFSDGDSTTRSISENTAASTNIGTPIVATDEDTDDTLTYTISGTDATAFDIVSTSGQLKTKNILNYEEKSSYTFTVTVTDGNNSSDTIAVTINITDINDPPKYIEGNTTKRSISENAPQGASVGSPIIVYDEDGDTLSFLDPEGPDSDSFIYQFGTNVPVTVNGKTYSSAQYVRIDFKRSVLLDYETKTSYSLTVIFSDPTVKSKIDITINLIDVKNDEVGVPPVFRHGDSTSRSVQENATVPTNIGNPVSATDANKDDTLTYKLAGVDSEKFNINSMTGQLQTKEVHDYETQRAYSVIVFVTDTTARSDSIDVTINITDDPTEGTLSTNQSPAFISHDTTSRTIPENTASDVDIGLPISAQDRDSGQTLTYSLVGKHAAWFSIDSETGQLKTLIELNYESRRTIPVGVFVSDGYGGSDFITVNINVTDVNDPPIFKDGESFTYNILNGGVGPFSLGEDIQVLEEDANNVTFQYTGDTDAIGSLSYHPSGSFRKIYRISSFFRSGFTANYATKPSYSVTITASDGRGGTSSIEMIVNVINPTNPSDTNRIPYFNHRGSADRKILEYSPVDTNIGNPVSASDSDTEDTLTYSLSGTDARYFSIESSTGQLKVKIPLVYIGGTLSLIDDVYFVVVSVDDGNGGTASTHVRIEVTENKNRSPEFTSGDSITFSIAENVLSGTNIGEPLTATDADTTDVLTYSLSSTDANSFSISSSTGQLQTNTALDYETKNTYYFMAHVSDSLGGRDTINVTVNITDVAEMNSTPSFTESGTVIRFIAENTVAETNIGNAVVATDTDTEDTLTYTLGGKDAASFAIDSATGQLKTKSGLDYETQNLYLVSITASDGTDSVTISVVISIIDVADTTISTTNLGVADRTPQVRDAIVATVPGVTDAASVTNAHLAAITSLNLRNKGISSLKTGDFSGLTGLTTLNLYSNMLSSLPNGIFSGLTALTSLRLGENSVDPMPIIVSLEQVSATEYQVVIPAGAPYDVSVPLVVSGGTNQESSGSVTVSKGNVKSNRWTVVVPAGSYVEIGTLPSLPEGHFGYALSKSEICNVTQAVAEGIAAAVTGVTDCRNVSSAQFAAITSLDLSSKSITSLQKNDFVGLLSLSTLNLESNQLSSLPDGIFAGLTSLSTLQLSGNTGSPFSFEISLEKVGTNQIKALMPIGAPFDINLPITVVNGSTNSSVSIATGRVESETLTVTRTQGSVGAVTVTIGTLPIIPSSHNGYALSKSSDLPLTIFEETNVAPVFTEGTTATRSIAENTAAGTNIGSAISATDANITDTLVYSLSGTDAASFSIVASTGQLQTKATLDYETKTSYTLTVNVTDNTHTDAITVTINVTDVIENAAPVFTDGTTATRSIAENTAAGTNIGAAIAATDTDNDTLTYTLSGTDANVFEIVGTSGQLRTKLNLNYEFKTSYSVTINVSDGKGGSDSIAVTIKVTDVSNEAPQEQQTTNNAPVFTEGASTTRSVPENTVAGTNIGASVSATDADPDDTLNYALSGTDASSFTIVSTSGQLQTKAALDYETTTSYSVTITVSDGNGGSDTINVTINVTDLNEDVEESNLDPIFTDGSTATRSIAENSAAGTHIGTAVSATDADNDTLVYTLSGTDAASFIIDGTSGQLKVSKSLNYEDKNTYDVTITVSDGNNAFDTINVTVNVTDVNDPPRFLKSSATFSIAEHTKGRIQIGERLHLVDEDKDELSFLKDGADADAFSYTYDSGVGLSGNGYIDIYTNANVELDYETKSTYTFKLRMSDDNNAAIIDVTINITDIIETPIISEPVTPAEANTEPYFAGIPGAAIEVAENTPAAQSVGNAFRGGDFDGDSLTFSLGGTDSDVFAIVIIGNTVQIKTKLPLDYETRSTYSVTLIVTDARGAVGRSNVVIRVTDVNEPPVFQDGITTSRNIIENSTANTNIGTTVSATDPDKNDTVTYSLGGTDSTSFSIDSATGQIKTKDALDYETKSSYSLTITATDSKGLTDTISVTINVSDLNETVTSNTPIFTDGATTTRSVPENSDSGTSIGAPIAATDADANTTLSYQISGTDAATFNIDSSTGQLITNTQLDYETKSSYTVTVTVTDGRLSDTITVTINVTDANDSPVFTEGDFATRKVEEGKVANRNVGPSFLAIDPDNDTVTYSMSGTDADSFTIESQTGQIKTHQPLRFETKPSYTVTITASDGTASDSISVTINIVNVNLAAPVFVNGRYTTRYIEAGTSTGVNIGKPITATDADEDTLTYSFSGLPPTTWFTIDATNGQIISKEPLRLGVRHSIYVRVTDGLHIRTTNVVIIVIAPNNPPSFAVSSANRSIAENSAAGINIGTTVNATDIDGDTLTYTLSGTDAEAFSFDSATGQLKTKTQLDYETKSTYSVKVTVTDGKPTGTVSIIVTINVTDVENENNNVPVFTEGETTTRTVTENTSAGTNIGTPVSATDTDTEDTLTYTLSGTDAESFSIDSATGQLKTSSDIDYEIKSSYSVIITVSDRKWNSTDTITVTINVTDVNENNNAPEFTDGTATTRSVPENTAAGVDIGTAISATDADTHNTLTYTLSGNNASTFAIVSTTGQIQTKDALDYETTNSYTVTVSVSDGEGGTDSITVTINVTDVLDTNRIPVFTDGTSTSRSIIENTVADESIGSPVSATDADNDTLTYTLGGTDQTSFSIDSTTGQLQTKDALDYETKASYSVTVNVSDGNGGTASINVTINVTDSASENSQPSFTDGSTTTRSIDEHLAENYSEWESESNKENNRINIGNVIVATDADEDTLAYSLTGTDANVFLIKSNGQLTSTSWFDYEVKSTYSIIITATDGNDGSDSITVTINVNNMNEKPYFGSSDEPSYIGGTINFYVTDDTPAEADIGNPVTASDFDADTTLTYTLRGTDASSFTLDSNTAQIQNNSVLDFETKDAYSITVTASDGTLSATTNVNINVVKLADPNVALRTPAVRQAIVDAVDGVNIATKINSHHLKGITSLDVSHESLTSLIAGDFNGLSGLKELLLNHNSLTSLPDGIFDELTRLERIDLDINENLGSVSGDLFKKNTRLKRIEMWECGLTTLPDGFFGGLSSLTYREFYQDHHFFLKMYADLEIVDDDDDDDQTAKYKVTINTGAAHDIDIDIWSVTPKTKGFTKIKKHKTVRMSTGSLESNTFTIQRTTDLTPSDSPNNAIYLILELPRWQSYTKFDDDDYSHGLRYERTTDTPLLVIPAQSGEAPAVNHQIPNPQTTQLLANFPNPFNPETWIPYQLNKPSHVSIIIYDIQGNVVRELDLGQKSAGYYTNRGRAAHWDGRNATGERVANGVYFYQLEAHDYTYLRKMLILK